MILLQLQGIQHHGAAAHPYQYQKIVTMYWYRDRHSGSAESIMTGHGRGMEEEEGSAVSDYYAQHFADWLESFWLATEFGLTIFNWSLSV